MKKLFILLILSFFSAQGLAAGCPDGSEPVKSISDDGTYFVYNCGGSNTANSSASSQKVAKALAGIDIENDPNIDFFKPPLEPYPTDLMYFYGRIWQIADYNNDGFSDVLYVGAMKPSNFISFTMFADEGDGEVECGDGDKCTGTQPLPSLFLGDADGNLTYSPHLLIDNREIPGMSLGGQLLVADYNNDDTLDFYITDTGIQDWAVGYRDSYFLSQPDGTWLESSNTHFSNPNFKAYNHGGASGDIDNDGDMDVVYTEMNSWERGTEFWCLMNDGTGFLKKRKCGGTFAFGLELADMDGDGDLDALVGAIENEYSSNPTAITGIVWNNGKGFFPSYDVTRLQQYKKRWGGIPEVSASDLDNDGDLDIVYSRVGDGYINPGIQIIENLGNKKFKDHGVISLDEKGSWIFEITYRDFDGDGDNDIYLASEGDNDVNNGTVLLNNGNFNFDLIRPDEALALFRDGSDSKIIIGHKKYIPTDEEQAVLDEIAELEAELEAEAEDAEAKRKAKMAAAKAKRLAEEAAKAAEADTVDTEQSVEDEIAAFEAELAAELGE